MTFDLGRATRMAAEGKTYAHIARTMGVTRNVVAGQMKRARGDAPCARAIRARLYTAPVFLRMDAAMHAEILRLAAAQKAAKSAVLRELIEWRLMATRGDDD